MRHEKQTCPGYVEDGVCPGDPLCHYTELARIQQRVDMQPAMRRAKKMLQSRGASARMLDSEFVYKLVCSIKNVEPAATVKDVHWPVEPGDFAGSDHINWDGDDE